MSIDQFSDRKIYYQRKGDLSYYNPSNIFLRARFTKTDWGISENMPQAIYPSFRILRFVIFAPSKLTAFLELRSRKTVRVSEQIMSANKYPSIFSRQMEAIVYIFVMASRTLHAWNMLNHILSVKSARLYHGTSVHQIIH